ncbi:dTMP kinase [Halorhodospira halochloris]|uniref:dTMP kinase n=1 Tax=Halorhodospira halochloris TaxID=1052 RepID=UPI001EE89478|nr:dTMP kinase [Halorhodospira halochloris]MCG5530762.1 dTMP kinase [Halorhodospira halochloris]
MLDKARGFFITIEGIEGAGKSTCLDAISSTLAEMGINNPIVTREPGGTEVGEAIRAILLNSHYRGMSGESEALLLFAARAEHVAQVIRPNVEAGRWVISDRFTDASYAYQGGGRGLGAERIATLEKWAMPDDIQPDITLLLDVEPHVGRERVGKRKGEADRFEKEQDDFFAVVREAYLNRAAAQPQRFRVIDANQSVDDVTRQVKQAIRGLIEQRSN